MISDHIVCNSKALFTRTDTEIRPVKVKHCVSG